MLVRDFDFDLPPELIAQEPPAERGTARLLCLDRASGEISHRVVADLASTLRAGDVLGVLLRNAKFNAETAEPAEKTPLKLCDLCVQPL